MVEAIHPGSSAPGARIAVLDFDGTVSLIRAGWVDIMVGMMLEVLTALDTGESEDDLRRVIEPFIWRLAGKDTLNQMIALAEQVALRGGTPPDSRTYKQQFHTRLFAVFGLRLEELRDCRSALDQYLAPGTRALLGDPREHRMRRYLASGTDDAHLKEEAALLDITRNFDGGVHGALPDPDAFSQRMLMEHILRLPVMRPHHLIGFGDGPVGIEELKRAGGVAAGLATDEPECCHTSPWKRRNLIEVGANCTIPNYLCRPVLLPMLFTNHEPI
ncbi:MAG: HAD family hydrolase [Candidatus Solibacter sp.]|nr:HAD family hydrolase [Candidatus Solibacter sp.]